MKVGALIIVVIIGIFLYKTYDYIINPLRTNTSFQIGEFEYRVINFYNGYKGGMPTVYCYLYRVHKMDNDDIFRFIKLMYLNGGIENSYYMESKEEMNQKLLRNKEGCIMYLTCVNVIQNYEMDACIKIVKVAFRGDSLCAEIHDRNKDRVEICDLLK